MSERTPPVRGPFVRWRSRAWHLWSRFWLLPGVHRLEWQFDLRCDGYRPCGPDRDGHRTHMAQYCLRLRGHHGMCRADVNYHGEPGPADFHPDAGGPQARLQRRYEQRLGFPPVREQDWRDDPCTVCGRSGTCNIVFCYREDDER